MTVTTDDLRHDLEAAFGRTREELIVARGCQQKKDTPSNRVAVQQAQSKVDRILDMHLDMGYAAFV